VAHYPGHLGGAFVEWIDAGCPPRLGEVDREETTWPRRKRRRS